MSCFYYENYLPFVQINKAVVKSVKWAVEVDLNFPRHLAEIAPKTRGVVKIQRSLFYFTKNTTDHNLIW